MSTLVRSSSASALRKCRISTSAAVLSDGGGAVVGGGSSVSSVFGRGSDRGRCRLSMCASHGAAASAHWNSDYDSDVWLANDLSRRFLSVTTAPKVGDGIEGVKITKYSNTSHNEDSDSEEDQTEAEKDSSNCGCASNRVPPTQGEMRRREEEQYMIQLQSHIREQYQQANYENALRSSQMLIRFATQHFSGVTERDDNEHGSNSSGEDATPEAPPSSSTPTSTTTTTTTTSTTANFTNSSPNHPSIASAYNNAAVMHKMLGQYQDAKTCYQQALQIYKVVLGEDHASYAATLNNIGNLLRWVPSRFLFVSLL